MVARALVNAPKILFLDEPTEGLDPASSQTIQNVIREERDRGATVFLTTHDMHEADILSDQVAFINQGKIVALDKPHNLKQQYGKRAIQAEIRAADGSLVSKEVTLDQDDTAQAVQELFANQDVITVHSEEATLEDIFIKITGRGVKRMSFNLIATLVTKDLKLYFKNRFFAFVTILALVGYSAIYLFLPPKLDERLELNLYAPDLAQQFVAELADEGIDITQHDSADSLQEGIAAKDFSIGIALPENYMGDLATSQDVNVDIYFASDFPEEFREFWVLFIRETSFTLAGKPLNIEVTETVLGHDLIGEPIAGRDRMLPLLAVFILMMETMGLASLITSEIEGGTIKALLVTPLTVGGLFLSKGIMGTGLAFVQASILMLVTGGFSHEPLIILTALLLGGLLATGLGLMIASVARDMMSVMAWSVLAILVLALPTFNVLLPGTISNWIQAIPSFYLVDAIHRVLNFGAVWADVGASLLILLAFSIVFFGLGVVMLRRKFS